MKQLILTTILLIGCSASSSAKIGETEAQIEARYGKSTGRWVDYLGYKKLYHWRGLDVMVNFSNGISCREVFEKNYSPFTWQEKRLLAEISGAGRNGVTFDLDWSEAVATTGKFATEYAAAHKAAWAKAEQDRFNR